MALLSRSVVAGIDSRPQVFRIRTMDVAPMSPLVLVMATLVMSSAALIAGMIPAWRASRIDPVVVLGK